MSSHGRRNAKENPRTGAAETPTECMAAPARHHQAEDRQRPRASALKEAGEMTSICTGTIKALSSFLRSASWRTCRKFKVQLHQSPRWQQKVPAMKLWTAPTEVAEIKASEAADEVDRHQLRAPAHQGPSG